MFEIAKHTFGFGGEGAILIQLMFLGVGAWLLSEVTSAAGQGRIASIIRVTGLLAGIMLVAKQAYDTIKAVAMAMGIGL
jgi:hypothetical protein